MSNTSELSHQEASVFSLHHQITSETDHP